MLFSIFSSIDNYSNRYDEFLQWNPADFNGIRRLNLPSKLIWLPDIVLYNVNKTKDPLAFFCSKTSFLINL